MNLTSCAAVLSSLLALGLFSLGSYLTLQSFHKACNAPGNKLKATLKLSCYALVTSLSLLYSTTYVTRDLSTGTSSFLTKKITYQNCEKKSATPFISEESEDDDEEWDGEEEIASLTTKSCFFNS